MSVRAMIDAVQDGIAFVERFKPIATSLGLPVGPVIEIAKSLTEIAENIVVRANETREVVSTNDQLRIRELTERLATINDELATHIANS